MIPRLQLEHYRYCHGNPLNKTDPNGTVDRSYTPGTSDYADQLVWEPTYHPKGIFTIAGHGDETGILRQGSNVPISTIMADMAKDGYKPGTPVLLVVCESGKGPNPFAGKLATALADNYGVKTSVHAPTTEFGVFKKGEKPVVMPERNRDFKIGALIDPLRAAR